MRVAAFNTARPESRQTEEEAMMMAKQIGNIIVAKMDPMTTTGHNASLWSRSCLVVSIATMRAGVELAAPEFERL